jgi:hypothetical protein
MYPLFSWNTTYIGDLHCLLYEQNNIVNSITLQGHIYHGIPMEYSKPEKIVVSDAICNVEYRVECIKPDDRFTCIALVRITQS